jgi:hypothetical protein
MRVSALPDEDGKPPKEDLNPPIGRKLTKVIGSKPWPPLSERSELGKEAEPLPPEADAPRR